MEVIEGKSTEADDDEARADWKDQEQKKKKKKIPRETVFGHAFRYHTLYRCERSREKREREREEAEKKRKRDCLPLPHQGRGRDSHPATGGKLISARVFRSFGGQKWLFGGKRLCLFRGVFHCHRPCVFDTFSLSSRSAFYWGLRERRG